jgi:ABC-type spermidine/putrescine transport system permease subunit II
MFAYLQQNVTPEIATVASLLLAATLMGAGLVYILSRQRRAADRGR